MSTDPAAESIAPIIIPQTTVKPVGDFEAARVPVPGPSPVATMAAGSPEPATEPAAAIDPPIPFDPYKRDIFTYVRDGKSISADPMTVWRAFNKALIAADEKDVDTLIQSAFFLRLDNKNEDGTPEYTPAGQNAMLWNVIDPARQTIVNAIRTAFGYTEVQADGTGMKEGEALDLFDAFWDMKNDVKKSTAMTPNS